MVGELVSSQSEDELVKDISLGELLLVNDLIDGHF